MKKMWKALALTLALSLMTAVAGCGSEGDTSTSTGSDTSTSTSGTEGKLRVALLLPGSLNDGGWNANAYAGLKDLEAEGYEVAFTENIAIAGIEEAMRNYAFEGYDLVIGHGAEFGEPAMRVAPEFPDVKFFVSGKMPDGVEEADLPENTGFMDMREYEAAYLAGIVAGGMTESNIIGYVAGLEIPSQLSDMAGFVQGVAASNPEAKVYGVVTGTFEDPAKGKEAATAQIDMGADIICQSADSTGMGAIEACLENNVKLIGYGGDQYEMAPDLMMTCFITDNQKVVSSQAKLIEDGTFGGLWEPGVAEGICYISDFHNFEDQIPQEIKDMVNQAIEDMKSGKEVVKYTTDRIDEKLG
ncbi:MAG: BMP family protein [Eubacteriales bacterium]